MEGSDLLSHGLAVAFGSVFVGGFLTSLTPCVYPLIPITVSLFGARDEAVSRGKALALAASYVNGMGVMYSALGVTVALAGKGFGTQLANPWVVGPIALLFLAMAASMFGAFEMNLPPELAQRLNKVGGKGWGGAFAMGLVGGLIAAPCTGPVLLSILTYIATTRSVGLGAALLYTYALGMGMLFFFIAAFAVRLPKSGAWMEAVKGIFGVSMIVAAFYFVRPVIPALARFASPERTMLYGALVAIAVGVAIGGIHLSFKYTGAGEKIRKAIGVVLIVGGVWQALLFVLTPRETHLVWGHDAAGIAAAEAANKASGKPSLYDFNATWCLPCKELDLKVFSNADVAAEMARFSLVKVDCSDDDDPEVRARQEKYEAKTLPTIVLTDSHGTIVKRVRRVLEPAEFLEVLRSVK